MVSGERLVLSTLLAGLYLPGIEELYLRSIKGNQQAQTCDSAKEAGPLYSLDSISPLEIPRSHSFSPDSKVDPSFIEAIVAPCVPEADYVQDSLTLYGGGGRLLDLIREKSPTFVSAPNLLRRHGFASEASRLERPGLLDLARQFVLEGAVLTPFHPESEWIWQKSSALPYALWCSVPAELQGQGGAKAEFPRRLFAVVGTRDVDSAGAKGAMAAALALHQGGWTLITGGAAGVDSTALDAVGGTMIPRGVVLHPQGLSSPAGQKLRRRWPWAWHLSLCAPWQEFEGRWAHQRNRIIFTLSEGAVSIGPRYRRGGTWSGALECLRSRLAPLALLADVGEKEALCVLKNLGAFEICLEDLASSRGPEIIGQIVTEGQRRRFHLAGLDLGQAGLFDPVGPVPQGRAESEGEIAPTLDPGRVRERQTLYSANELTCQAA